jgi:hypothetical protein
MARNFLELDPRISFEWKGTIENPEWMFNGGRDESAQERFYHLAAEAGLHSGGDPARPADHWFTLLRDAAMGQPGARASVSQDGRRSGRISHACDASEHQCRMLESQAIEFTASDVFERLREVDGHWAVCPSLTRDSDRIPQLFPTEEAAKLFLKSEVLHLRAGGRSIVYRQDLGWHPIVPVAPLDLGVKAHKTFAEFFPLESIGIIVGHDWNEVWAMLDDDRMLAVSVLLSERDWKFDDVVKDCKWRQGHQFSGLAHRNIMDIALKGVYDLEDSLYSLHPKISAKSIAAFFRSWQLWVYVSKFCERIETSQTALAMTGHEWKAKEQVGKAKETLYQQFCVYAAEVERHIKPTVFLEPTQATESSEAKLSREELRVKYWARFPGERIKVLDVCWAANQHYSEWKRWLRGPGVLRDGLTADLAFRAILRSGKRPSEYRREPRPHRWE